MTDFYDRTGTPIAYMEDGAHIYFYSGQPVAYLEEDAIYTYRGEQLGWFEDGWVRDRSGRCVAFSEHVLGGPLRPRTRPKPHRGHRLLQPPKETRDPRQLRPIHSNAWSQVSARDFFSSRSRLWSGNLLPSRNQAGRHG